MANELPQYREQVTLGAGPSAAIQPVPLGPNPSFPDAGAGYRAAASFGDELVKVAEKLNEGQQQTLASQAMEGFLQKRAALTDKYVQDQDFSTANDRFAEDIGAAKMEALGTINDQRLRDKISLEMERDIISASNKVRTAQFGRQADVNIAANDTLRQTAINEAVGAGSDAEYQAAIGRYKNDLERLVAAGWMDASTAQKKALGFRGELEGAEAYALVNKNPAQAKAMLADPANWPTLDPMKRQTLMIAAEQRVDANQQAGVVQAAVFHQEAATLSMGRVVAPDHAIRIFDNGIVPIESGGDAAAVSKKGALGASQIMPATAREVAAGLGLKDVASLSDEDLKKKLTSSDPADQALNLKLGRAYWSQMVTRYDGNVALAAAAYNAGPGRADRWRSEAEAKFGATFTPAQLASVIDIKETQDYLGKLYGRYNAPMNVQFSSPAAAMQASNAVGAVLTQQAARETHLLTAQAQAASSADNVVEVVRAGFDVDPSRVTNFRAINAASAAKGDAAAAGRLRDLDYAEKIQPLIRQAWATPPDALDTMVKSMEAQAAAPGGNPSTQTLNAIKAFKAVQDEQAKKRDTEPVVLGGENGGRYYALQPIDGRNAPLDDNLVSALKNRDAQARTASLIYGGSGSPFTLEEAQAFQSRYADATPQERGQILGVLARGLSPDTFAAALPKIVKGENSKSEAPVLQMAAGLYAKAPDIAQSVIEGLNAQDAEKRYVPVGEANKLAYQTSKDSYLPQGLFNRAMRTDPSGPFAALSAAIDARYAYLSADAKDTSGATNTARLKRAIDDVTGGVLYHNGAPLIAPVRGMDQQRLDRIVFSLTDDHLAGAQTTSGTPITAEYVRGSAKLQSRDDGRYYLQVNRDNSNPQYAVTKDGRPFVLDLRIVPITETGRRYVSPEGTRAFVSETARSGDRLQAGDNP